MPIIENHLSFVRPKPIKSDYPLLVFLPGMDGTGQLYKRQAEHLERFFDIRCLTIPPNDLSDWDRLAASTIDLIRAELKQERLVYLCGESFGGCLALKVALADPSLFAGTILVNPASAFNQHPWLDLGIPLTQWVPSLLHYGVTVAFLPFLAALGRIEPSDRRALLQAMQSLPQTTIAWRLSLLKNFSVTQAQLRQFDRPVLLIASALDRLLPSIEEAKRLARDLPNTQTIVLPKSGHACLLETEIGLDRLLGKWSKIKLTREMG